MGKYIRKEFKDKLIKANAFLFQKGPVILFLLGGLYYVNVMILDRTKDTTLIGSTAFALISVLASLSFGCARAIDDDNGVRDRFIYAGERFFHGSLLIFLATVFKYALIDFQGRQITFMDFWVIAALESCASFFAPFVAFWALLVIHTGIKIISEELWRRTARHKDWDDLY